MSNQTMERGVIYKVSGGRYVKEVLKSAKSLKRFHPDLPITVLTDHQIDSQFVDTVLELSNPMKSMGDSILKPEDIVYDYTLYLDSDTYICDDIIDVFYLLERSDVAMAFEPHRQTETDIPDYASIPSICPNFNAGVIALRDSERVA